MHSNPCQAAPSAYLPRLPNVNATLRLLCVPRPLALVATTTVPLYRDVVELAVTWRVDVALIAVVIAFEATAGALTLWRGPLARVALLAAAAWGLGMLPVIPPYGLPIGLALTGAPALAAALPQSIPRKCVSLGEPVPGHGSTDPPACLRASITRGGDTSKHIQEERVKLQTYVGAAIVWAGIFIASALLLQGTPYFSQMLPNLSGGAAWFVVIIPGAWQRRRARGEESSAGVS
jgi:hypothetical protein